MSDNQSITIGEKIKEIYKKTGLTQKEFGILLGYGERSAAQTMQGIFKGEKGVSVKTLMLLNTILPRLNYNWLLKGIGSMLILEEEEVNVEAFKKKNKELMSVLKDLITENEEMTRIVEELMEEVELLKSDMEKG